MSRTIGAVIAGAVTWALLWDRAMTAVWWLAGVQLALGIGIEASAWSLTPVWYHVVFLGLLVPATVYGATLLNLRRTARV